MQTNEMINQPSEFVPPVEHDAQPVEKHYITFTEEELAEFIKIPGVDTVTFSPDEWMYFAEELQNKAPREAYLRAKFLAKTVEPPRKFETPQYPYIPAGDKSPGIDTVDLTPAEWKYFVEEVQTKTPFKSFNNAKYLVELDQSLADDGIMISMEELERFVNG